MFLGTVKYEGFDFDCYGEFDQPDYTVGYNGAVYIDDVKINDKSVLDIIKQDVINFLEAEIHYELS